MDGKKPGIVDQAKEYIRGGRQKNHYSEQEVEACLCPLCSGNDYDRIYRERGSLVVVQCSGCGLIYVNPRVKQAETNYWGDEKIYREEARYIFTGEKKHHRDKNYEQEIREIKKIKKAGALLDIGCSMGFFLRKAREAGFQATGVEPSPSLSNIAREQFGLNIINTYLEEAALPERSFDVITMIDVFEHVTNPRELLRCAARLLKDDGLICIKVPNGNYNMLKLKLARISGREARHDIFDSYEHVAHYTIKTMRQMLDICDLRAQRVLIPRPIHPPVWARLTGHYYQHASPFRADWKRIILRNLFYMAGRTEHALGLAPRFAPDLMFMVRKK
ncbi:MAG: class I SAM-dependent methyltransferase [Bacteroidota bacterium]